MIVVDVVKDWASPGVAIELPGVPRLGDVVVVNDDLDGAVVEVVWQPGQHVAVRLG